MRLKVVALVSVGRHPASGRPRRSPLDARAVELGLRLVGAELALVHAGDPAAPTLRDYLGMGAAHMTVLDIPPQADAWPALSSYLRELRPDLVLLGQRGEGGEDSGMLPYLLAEALALPVVAGAVEVTPTASGVRVLQALPRGQRRLIGAPLPCVVATDGAAPAPRQSAYGLARRGRIVTQDAVLAMDTERQAWRQRPARKRPRRLKLVKAASGAARLAAATGIQGGGGKVVRDTDPAKAAQVLYDYLKEQGVVRSQ